MQRTNSSNITPQRTGPGRGFLHVTAELKNINYSEILMIYGQTHGAKGNKLAIAMLCLLGIHRGIEWGN